MAAVLVLSTLVAGGMTVKADPQSLSISSLKVLDSTGAPVADLTAGEEPALKAGKTYCLSVNYSVPSSLQGSATYVKITLGDGLYFSSLPGATFTPGPINDTSFEALVQGPEGTGTAPYEYPGSDSAKKYSGIVIYRTKSQLTSVSSSQINFCVDDAFENEDTRQILENAITVCVGSTTDTTDQQIKSNVIAADACQYNFWVDGSAQSIGKEVETSDLEAYMSGSFSPSLTKAGSKTSVEIVYPKSVTLVSLKEYKVYKKNGTIVSTVEEGGNYVSTVEWDEEGGLKGDCGFQPHLKVSEGSSMPEGTTFQVILRNYKKTVWNEDTGRTSGGNQAVFTVTYIEQGPPAEAVGGVNVIDSMPNWSLNQNDTYNVRLGCYPLRNPGTKDSAPKTIEIRPDTGNTAIIRGVTIPWTGSIDHYGSVYWEASDGSSGTADNSVITSPGAYEEKDGKTIYGGTKSGALITNTALGLDINTSITYIKVDIGSIPKNFIIPEGLSNLMNNSQAESTTIDSEYYGWRYVSCGVYGAWKEGTSETVRSDLRLYNTGESSDSGLTAMLQAQSSAPEVLNGVGNINKQQVTAGDSFTISGWINNSNWDWNLLQDPVLYVFMPEGFSHSNLKVTKADSVSGPEEIGTFTYAGQDVTVYKYKIDIGHTTRGTYQPDFTSKDMTVSMTVTAGPRARIGTYHINDFLGFSTENFGELKAVIKADHWDHSNWNTQKYTEALNASTIGGKVNDGFTMVSLSEKTGVAVKQGYEITAQASFSVKDAETGTVTNYIYDDSTEETKKNTTAVLERGDTVTMTIDVKNNAKTYLDHCTIYVPLMNKEANFGGGFMPEGANGFDMQLTGVTAPDSMQVQYIKLHEGKTYGVNESPQEGDFDVVDDPAQADMVRFVTTREIADGEGGTITLSFKPDETLSSENNGARIVITPMLDFDINGNRSSQTKEAAAITYHQPEPTPVTAGDPPVTKQLEGDTPSEPADFTFTLKADPSASVLPDAVEENQMPMPEKASGAQSMVLTIHGAGTSEFGAITFTKAGTYVYEITENNTGKEGYTYDTARYLVTYEVTVNGGVLECSRTITKNGEEADDVIFTNTYKEEESSQPDSSQPDSHKPESSTPTNSSQGNTKTGDGSAVPFWVLILCLGSLAMAGMMADRRRRQQEK